MKHTIKHSYKEVPYYMPSTSFMDQAKKGSSRKNRILGTFIIKKIFNYVLERIAYNCPVNSWRVKIHKLRGVKIGKNVFIGLQVTLDHSYPEYIYIGDNVSLAGNNFILTHSNPYEHFKNSFKSYIAPVIIDDGAWVSINSTILPGVTIGEKSVIAAGSIVQKDVPNHVIAGGIPAKVIKDIEKER